MARRKSSKKSTAADLETEWEVEAIRGIMTLSGKIHYYVKWKGYADKENTWEPAEHVENCVDSLKEALGHFCFVTHQLETKQEGRDDKTKDAFMTDISDLFDVAQERDAEMKERERIAEAEGLVKKLLREEKRKEKAEKRKRDESSPQSNGGTITKKRLRREMPHDVLNEEVISAARQLGAIEKKIDLNQNIYGDLKVDRDAPETTPLSLLAFDALDFESANFDADESDKKRKRVFVWRDNQNRFGQLEIGVQWIDDHSCKWVEDNRDAVMIASSDEYIFLVKQDELDGVDDPVVYITKFDSTSDTAQTMTLSEFLGGLRAK